MATTLGKPADSDTTVDLRLTPSPESPELLAFEPEMLGPEMTLLTLTESDQRWDEAERFVYEVYQSVGFCAKSDRHWVEETEPWREGSTLYAVTDPEDRIVGVVRSILAPFDELPVSQFRPTVPVREGILCEIGSLAVAPGLRGLGVANELHKAAWQEGILAQTSGFCFLIDQWMFDFFRDVYGLPVRAIGETRRYMGGDVVPTAMWMPEMIEQVARIRPRFYKRFIEDVPITRRIELDLPIILD